MSLKHIFKALLMILSVEFAIGFGGSAWFLVRFNSPMRQ